MKRYAVITSTAVAAVLLLSGCGSDSGSDSAAPNAGTQAATQSAAGTGAASADAAFAQAMIPHHEQAVDMSQMMLAKEGVDPEVKKLAEDIKAAQGPEIEKMHGWLEAWGQPTMMAGGSDHSSHSSMSGMMSEADLGKLKSAEGTEASRMFLEQMIEHHKGAITMAEQEAANGTNPDAVELAKKIVADQQAEIDKMQVLLAGL
ncbi:DUF305 domain-containing protein [Arthrobacter mangrovi]|uniref:DUF305 domain-containing protein n=1 Tax=Arthrobacter mangrovi TaxID=2966350 RepID=A0ABQ5MZD1_9MICC|nr:DUF305 domain-containing protein [Arthrobacter mangrovi]GLB69285.1 DUF305 domain-containing protein [Arthrobacter mangrovi]